MESGLTAGKGESSTLESNGRVSTGGVGGGGGGGGESLLESQSFGAKGFAVEGLRVVEGARSGETGDICRTEGFRGRRMVEEDSGAAAAAASGGGLWEARGGRRIEGLTARLVGEKEAGTKSKSISDLIGKGSRISWLGELEWKAVERRRKR